MKVLIALALCCVLISCEGERYKEPTEFDYAKLHQNHLMVLGKNSADAKNIVDISESDKTTIVDNHNDIRKAVTDLVILLKMRWDEQLARMARGWAAQCPKEDPSDEQKNLPMYDTSVNNVELTAAETVADGVKKMAADSKMKVQVTQTFTSHVGCGLATCGNGKRFVCVYAPRNLPNGENTAHPSIPEAALNNARKGICGKLEKWQGGKCHGNMVECNLDDKHSDICYYGNRLDYQTCRCRCEVSGKDHGGPKCAGIVCRDYPHNRDTSCDANLCKMTYSGPGDNYRRHWLKCQQTCNDHFGQSNCGLPGQ